MYNEVWLRKISMLNPYEEGGKRRNSHKYKKKGNKRTKTMKLDLKC